MFCEYCQRQVGTKKKFNWLLFIVGLLLFGVGAIVYLAYYFLFAPHVCKICGSTKVSKQKKEKTTTA